MEEKNNNDISLGFITFERILGGLETCDITKVHSFVDCAGHNIIEYTFTRVEYGNFTLAYLVDNKVWLIKEGCNISKVVDLCLYNIHNADPEDDSEIDTCVDEKKCSDICEDDVRPSDDWYRSRITMLEEQLTLKDLFIDLLVERVNKMKNE